LQVQEVTHSATKPLAGVRVLDLGRMFAAPFAGQMLGDLGAEVIKVERIDGDEMRHYGPPFLKDQEGCDLLESTYSLACNRNKRSIGIDLRQPDGPALVHELAAVSDVLIENFKVGDLARYGLDQASMRARYPQLVYLSITGFGQDGPYASRPGVDTIFQAMSGIMSVTGEASGPPQKVGLVVVDLIAGLYAVIGVLSALRHREVRGGKGQHIDLALLDAAVATMSHRALEYLMAGITPQRRGTASVGNVPARNFDCSDGALCVQAGGDPQFRKLCRAIGRPELAEDDRFRTRPGRVANEAALLGILEPLFLTRTAAAWYETLVEEGVFCGPIHDVPEVFADPQVRHRGLRESYPHPLAGTVSLVANPLRFSETPIAGGSAPPLSGADAEEILRAVLGKSTSEIDRLKAAGAIGSMSHAMRAGGKS
jgi:crotonobetainyl-CoA:carnitine CoA-transferase CaiB-like acyl-CoA transferase